MSQTDSGADSGLDEAEVAALAATVEGNADELRELLEVVSALQATAEDLAPELRNAVRENREPLEAIRMALEREELIDLLRELGENAETLTELLALLEALEGLTTELTPELRRAVRENRDAIARLRTAVENEELLVLVERVGENADALAEALDLLAVTRGLATDLLPELQAATGELRPTVENLRLVTEGFVDATADHDVEPYQLGRNLGNVTWFASEIGDPQFLELVDAGLSGFTDDDPDEVGLLGLLGALRDRDVRRGLGRVVAFLRQVGST
jgi:uncharacterized protein YjgD (DUF1641 family)